MTNNNDATIGGGFPGKTASRLSMISILAISAGMAAAPVHAQDMTASPAPVQAAPILTPQPASPTMAAPAATAQSAPAAEPAPTVNPTRADDLATRGGFDAATVAPEALAEIESEQQTRRDAAAAAAAKSAAATRAAAARSAPPRTNSAAVIDSSAQAAPGFDDDGSTAVAEGAADSLAVLPMIQPVPERVTAPETIPADGGTDWSLLAALAAMLGVGGAGAYAATRRRRSKSRKAAALNAAIMPELRREPARTEVRPTVEAALVTAQPMKEDRENAEMDLAEFVATLPAFESPRARADRHISLGQRRVPAAPRPYLGEADLSRPAGYFTSHVDDLPTPQNPFLTRQKRIHRARYLDRILAERKASRGDSRTRVGGKMQVSRPMEPAFA